MIFDKLLQKICKNALRNCDKLIINLCKKREFGRFFSTKKVKPKTMKYLNVAEKHDAAKNIANILSNGSASRREGLCIYNKIFDFQTNVNNQNCKMVMTSVSGHLLNYEFLPPYKGWNNCSPDQLFDAPIKKNIANLETGEKIKKTIEREVKSCQGLIIWTDCDREGENIGFEILEICRNIRPNLKVFRAKFSEITRTAIFRALSNLTQPDHKQNEAVEIRQELDLRTGAAFTRYQTLRLQKLFPGTTADKLISYGSCQIPTLGFVAERYKEVEDFVSEPFWKLVVTHTIDDLTVEFNWARNRLFNKEAVEDYLLLCLTDPKATVENKTVKPKNKWRPQPMDTVELEKLGSRKLKINAKETMNIAEKLYNKGLISYPRTETNSFSSNFNLTALVEQHTSHSEWGSFATKVLQWKPNPRNGKKTDEAHPPIHPLKLTTNLDGNEGRVYELIVRHFLACVSRDATGSETIVNIDIAGEKFSANGLVIYERNYLDVYPYEKWNAKQIHHYDIEQVFEPTEIAMREGATTAPPLLTEADLIALMEKNGIGTDATHAEHIHTIKERGYIGEVGNGLLVPGTIGMGLYEGYGAMDLELAKPRLRAEFESDLKKICNGEKNSKVVLREQIVKYREAYNLITQRITAMDEKFASRVNETPSNRRNDGDRDPGSGGNGGGGHNGNDDDDDDDNDGGGNPTGFQNNNNNNWDNEIGLPQRLQELFLCPKCKSCKMVLKKKKDGSSYMIGCSNFPVCRNVIWLLGGVKEAKLSQDYCTSCGNMDNENSRSRKIEFKFRSNSHLTLLCSTSNSYTTCIRCDSKFREVFDINLDQVKCVGAIVGVDFENSKRKIGLTNSNQATKSKTSTRQKPEIQKRNFSSSSKLPLENVNTVSNIDSVFDDNFFDNGNYDDKFDDVLVNLGSSLVQNYISTNSNENNNSNISNKREFRNLKNKKEIDAYFTGWNKSATLTNAPTNLNPVGSWGEPYSDTSDQVVFSSDTGTQLKSSKWLNLKNSKNENSSYNIYSSTNRKNSISSVVVETHNNNLSKRISEKSVKNSNLLTNNESQVKCKSCSKQARKLIVKKDGPNKGREFYCCENDCKFFQWADEVPQRQNPSSNSLAWGSSQFSEAQQNVPEWRKCECKKVASIKQVRKEGSNNGKWFYACSVQKCSYFKWAENDDDDDFSISSWGTKKQPGNERTKTSSLNNKSNSTKRKCGLCRMEGHTKKKCPRQEEFGGF